jgi:hypothetical protein
MAIASPRINVSVAFGVAKRSRASWLKQKVGREFQFLFDIDIAATNYREHIGPVSLSTWSIVAKGT